ncbi:MAG TPA: TolC family protein [Polyangiales bacterium]|nr:TolC family protein [Polyangiales bacterium]
MIHLRLAVARIACVLFAVQGFGSVARAEPLSRASAIARALAKNPQLDAARAIEYQARARRAQADAARFPNVSVVLGAGPSLKAKLVPGTGALSTENTYGDVGWNDLSVAVGGQVDVTQPLYTFGKIDERRRAAEHEIRARRAQSEMTQARVAYSVAELYEGLLFARDAQRFFEETDRWLERTVDDTREKVEEDRGVPEEDLLRLQSAIGPVKLGRHRADAARRQAEAGLVAYLVLPTGTSLEPSEPALELLAGELPDREALIRIAREQRPELRALREGGAAFDALAAAEAAGNLPDFFALAFASGAYTPGREVADSRYVRDPLNGFYPGFLLGARWQFWGPMASERANENRAKARELEATRRWAAAGVPAEVTKAFEDVQRARLDASEVDKAVGYAKRWAVMVAADYAIGMTGARDLDDAVSAYVQLRIAELDALYRHNVALAELTRVTAGFVSAGPRSLYPTHKE